MVRKGNGKLAYAGMPEADREMPELINQALAPVCGHLHASLLLTPPSLPQATAWIKSDGIVVDNPELVTARKVCRATYYEPTQQAPHATYYEPTHQVPLHLL